MFPRNRLYIHTEHGLKNRSGGLCQLNVENKQVAGYATPDTQPRCIVFLLDKYLRKLPNYAFEKDVFIFERSEDCQMFLVPPGMMLFRWDKIRF